MKELNRLLFYTERETFVIANYFKNYIVQNEKLTAIDGYKIGILTTEFVYFTQTLKATIANDFVDADDIMILDKVISVLKEYDDIITYVCDLYDYMVENLEPEKNYLYKEQIRTSIGIPSFDLNEEQKKEILNFDLSIVM